MAEDKPICPMKMTFEELLEMKLKQNAEADAFNSQPSSPGRKQSYLKKGEGLSRWTTRGPNSPETEQPATPQSKPQNVKRKIVSASRDVAKPTAVNHPVRVPSHVVPPRSPRQAHPPPTKLPSKPHQASSLVKRGKQSPVPPSPRAVHSDFSVKNSSVPRLVSPATSIPPLSAPSMDPDPFFNKPTDMTLCSEKEFEQMEEFLGDQPHDISICSQASVVRKFMSRPSIGAKPTKSKEDTTSKSAINLAEPLKTPATGSSQFQDDETWGPEPTSKYIPVEISKSPTRASPELVETPTRSKEPVEHSTATGQHEKPQPCVLQPTNDPLQPLNDVLRSKIAQLDVEIEKFRTENRRLEERKSQFEKVQSEFIGEKRKFEEQMETESSKFEQFKRQEMSKIKRERAALDQLRTQVHTLASEKNSVELVQLRERLRRVEQESSDRDERHAKELGRAKEQIKRLQGENEELKRSIELLERLRIDRNAAAAHKASNKTDASPRVGSALQSLRKPLPLKSDARQNCIPQALPVVLNSTADTNASKTSAVLNERQQQSQSQAQQAPVTLGSCSDKEDEVQHRDLSSPAVPLNEDEDEPLGVGRDSAQQEDAKADNQQSVEHKQGAMTTQQFLDSMDPAHASLLQQWLTDIGFCLFEDDETCIATLEKEFPDGKIEVTRSDGSRRICFANGTVKIVGAEGQPMFIRFFNKDMKKVDKDGSVFYYYADTQTIQSTFADGLEVMEFSNGQIEKKYPNGAQDVVFPDGTIKQTYPDGMEVCTFVDGCVVTTSPDGQRVIDFPNGQREMHTAEYKSRVYPNGIVRIVFNNGLCETRYPNGEVRRKYIRETTTNDAMSAGANTGMSSQDMLTTAAASNQ